MKIKQTVSILFLILLAASSPVYANNSRPFIFPSPVTINGAVIPAGEYQLSWESHNSNVNVTFSKDGQFVAGIQGEWVKHGIKYTGDAALVRVNPDGSRSLVEIRIAGTKKTIVFSDPIIRVNAS